MGDSKKRVAGIQLTKDNPEVDDDGPEPEMGTFKRASDEVLATRKIVKVRCSQPSAATSNPFASLRMVPPSNPSANRIQLTDGADAKLGKGEENNKGTESGTSVDEPNGIDGCNKKVEEKTDTSTTNDDRKVEVVAVAEATQLVEAVKDVENGDETAKEVKEETEKKPNEEENENKNAHEEKAEKEKLENNIKDADADKPVASLNSFLNSFQQLSSSQNAFTGLAGTGFGTSSFSFGSMAKEGSSFSGFNTDNNGRYVTESGILSMQEVPVETGEENEKAVFTADAILYEHLDGGWKERGKGEVKLNVSLSDAEKARLIMRASGNYRLILNASLYPDMMLANMDKNGITFACFNSAGEGKGGLATFALKFKDGSFVEEFRGAVAAHQGKKTVPLKTPENSLKASDD